MDFFERDGDEWLLETCLINALMSCGGTLIVVLCWHSMYHMCTV